MQKTDPPPYSVLPNAPPVQAQAPIIIQTQTNFGPDSQQHVCQYCHANIKTTTRAESTTKTHIAALLLCLFLCIPCICVPYCMDSCQNKNHYCPNCKAYLGTYHN